MTNLRKKLLLLLVGFSPCFLCAQYTLHITLSVPPTPPADTVFVAGNFNNWNPGNMAYRLKKDGDSLRIDIPALKPGVYEFKFTKGNWDRVECTPVGSGIENHRVLLVNDLQVSEKVVAWQDQFVHKEREHTASKQVSIISDSFRMSPLSGTRRIWLYLPAGYGSSKKHYPVLYMHDGQNVFDAATSGFGEWGVDECLDSLIAQGLPPVIVVGIDNGPKRMNEYNPYDFREFGKGEGDAYLNFIVQHLKPFIDSHYRTLKDKKHTLMAGSSMGGLISYYAVLRYPSVFGMAGIFSPAFWTAPAVSRLTDSLGSHFHGKLFFYIGDKEGASYVADMNRIATTLQRIGAATIYAQVDPAGSHNETAWRKWFPVFYTWMMTGEKTVR